MAEAAVRLGQEDALPSNDNEPPVLEDENSRGNPPESKKKRRTRSSTKSRTKPSSTATSSTTNYEARFENLESRMEERFQTLLDTFSQGFSRLEERRTENQQNMANSREEREDSSGHIDRRAGSARHRSWDEENSNVHDSSASDDSPRRRVNDDVLSVNVRPNERDEIMSHHSSFSDDRISSAVNFTDKKRTANDKFGRYLEKVDKNDNLTSIFGEANHSEDDIGIILDETQVSILNKSWRSEDPEKITAYKEDTKLLFPVHSKSGDVVKVPLLDDLLEPLLRKQNNSFRAWGRTRHLASPSMKSIENTAFQGQIAARLGILSVAYMQQALAKLLGELKDETVNIDRAIQSVRDIYDMSTKSLDQVGRAGAFHHIVRRKAAVADSGLSSVKDMQNKVLSLPLSGEGVCGKGLEEKLKQRKEQREQLNDLLPEYGSKSSGTKRRGSTNYQDYSSNRWPSKRPRTEYSSDYRQRSRASSFRRSYHDNQRNKSDDTSRSTKSWGGFRIPKKK